MRVKVVDKPIDEIASRIIMARIEKSLKLNFVAWSCCDQVRKEMGRHKMIGEKVDYRVKVVVGKYWYRNRVGEVMNAVWDAGVWILVNDKNPPDKLAWRCVRKQDVDLVDWDEKDSGHIKTTGG